MMCGKKSRKDVNARFFFFFFPFFLFLPSTNIHTHQHKCDLIDKIYNDLDSTKPDSKIVMVGHSMGACLTGIAAYQLGTRYPDLRRRILVINMGL